MLTPEDCYPWQPGGCEWTIRYVWRWISSFGRLDVIVLALMLIYVFAVVIHVSLPLLHQLDVREGLIAPVGGHSPPS